MFCGRNKIENKPPASSGRAGSSRSGRNRPRPQLPLRLRPKPRLQSRPAAAAALALDVNVVGGNNNSSANSNNSAARRGDDVVGGPLATGPPKGQLGGGGGGDASAAADRGFGRASREQASNCAELAPASSPMSSPRVARCRWQAATFGALICSRQACCRRRRCSWLRLGARRGRRESIARLGPSTPAQSQLIPARRSAPLGPLLALLVVAVVAIVVWPQPLLFVDGSSAASDCSQKFSSSSSSWAGRVEARQLAPLAAIGSSQSSGERDHQQFSTSSTLEATDRRGRVERSGHLAGGSSPSRSKPAAAAATRGTDAAALGDGGRRQEHFQEQVQVQEMNEQLLELLAQFYAHQQRVQDQVDWLLISKQREQQQQHKLSGKHQQPKTKTKTKSQDHDKNHNRSHEKSADPQDDRKQWQQQQQQDNHNHSHSRDESNEQQLALAEGEGEGQPLTSVGLRMQLGADEESLMKWLRQRQDKFSLLKNVSFELIHERPNKSINVCADGPKILVLPNVSDILYCYTEQQWLEKLWSDLRLSAFHYPIILLNVLIFLFGTTGNIFVCLSVKRNHQLRSVTNYFIVNLALADFLVILICLPATVVWDLSLTWFFDTIPCKLIMFLQDVSISVSVLTLTAISIDRYYAICHPLKFKSSLNQAKRIIALIWLVSILIMTPDLIYLSAQRSQDLTEAGLDTVLYSDCNYQWSEQASKWFQFVKTILLYMLPFLLMFCAHYRILKVLRLASAMEYPGAGAEQQLAPPTIGGCQPQLPPTQMTTTTASSVAAGHYGQRRRKSSSLAPLRRDSRVQSEPEPEDKELAPVVVSTGGSGQRRRQQQQQEPQLAYNSSGQPPLSSSLPPEIELMDRVAPGSGAPKQAADSQPAGGLLVIAQDGVETELEPNVNVNTNTNIDVNVNPNGANPLPTTATATATAPAGRQVRFTGPKQRASGPRVSCNHLLTGELPASGGQLRRSPGGAMRNRNRIVGLHHRATRGLQSLGRQLAARVSHTSGRRKSGQQNNNNAAADGANNNGNSKQQQQQQQLLAANRIDKRRRRLHEMLMLRNSLDSIDTNNNSAAAAASGQLDQSRPSGGSAARGRPAGKAGASDNNNNNNSNGQQCKIVTMGQIGLPSNNLSGGGRRKYSSERVKASSPGDQQQQQHKLLTNNNNNNNNIGQLVNHHRAANNNNNNSGTNSEAFILTMHNKSKLESRRKAAMMLTAIVVLFGICYLPVHLINFLRQFIDDIPQTDVTSTISMLAHCVCYLNSAINPIIYNHMNSVFRAEFRKFLSCLDWRRPRATAAKPASRKCLWPGPQRQESLGAKRKSRAHMLTNQTAAFKLARLGGRERRGPLKSGAGANTSTCDQTNATKTTAIHENLTNGTPTLANLTTITTTVTNVAATTTTAAAATEATLAPNQELEQPASQPPRSTLCPPPPPRPPASHEHE